MSLSPELEEACQAARRDLRVIRALAQRVGDDAWPSDVRDIVMFLVERVEELEAESETRLLTIQRLIGGSSHSQERALARQDGAL